MTDTTIHPSLSAIDTLESLATEALDESQPVMRRSSDFMEHCDSSNTYRNCQTIIAIQKRWLDDPTYGYEAMTFDRANAIKRLLTDLFYNEAAKHITT